MSTELRQTSSYANYMRCLGWQTTFLKQGIFIYIKKVIPLFYIAKVQRFDKVFTLEQLKDTFKNKGLYVVYLEPNSESQKNVFIKKYNFKESSSPLVPSKTIRVDLTKSESDLLKEMHYKARYNINKFERHQALAEQVGKTRYNIKKNINSQFSILNSKNVKEFADFWQQNALKRGMFLSLKHEIKEIYNAFGENANIVVAKWGDKIVSAIMTINTDDSIYYMYAASTSEGNKIFAPTALVWQAINLGKKKNLKYLDFEGIFDSRFPLKTWKGFTRFKKSFGGQEIEYPGVLKKILIKY